MTSRLKKNLSIFVVVLCYVSVLVNKVNSEPTRNIDDVASPVEQIEIPAGPFQFGCSAGDRLCAADEGRLGGIEIIVPAFLIDVHETSVAEYDRCVVAKKCTQPFDYLRSHYCNYGAPQRSNYPLNCVNWRQAYTYCQWRGGRLAYEVEWEKAARGGTSTPYYWGHEPASCDRAVIDGGQRGQPDSATDGCWRDLSWERGSFAPNPYGLFDVIGGTSEWVMDWYDKNAHSTYYSEGILTGPRSGKTKTIKSGSWDEKHWAQRVSNRYNKPIVGNLDLYGSNGIRCVIPNAGSLKHAQSGR